MRLLQYLALSGLLLAPLGICRADSESTWFSTELDALHALADGTVLPVLECDGCDVDDPLHRTTGETLQQVLREFQANGLPTIGAFVLRERVTPRFTYAAAIPDADPSGCATADWTPSLALWRYDLASGWVKPVYTACLPFLDAETNLRVSCADCDLDALQPNRSLVEGLRHSLGSPTREAQVPMTVRTGELLVTDPTDRGFRRVEFRAYGSRVYLGSNESETVVLNLDMDPVRALASARPEVTP
jgi:hypothetical protein